jgi:hypothetical protein
MGLKPHPHHLHDTARIVAVRLLICAFSTARMCRVSTQTIGNSASARAPNSHCDSGTASNPIRRSGRRASKYRQQSLGFARYLHFPSDLARVIHKTLVALTDTFSPPKWSMLRFSF